MHSLPGNPASGDAVNQSTPKRIAVVGSREYACRDAVRQFVWEQERGTVIISGGAAGVDSEAVHAAQCYGMAHEVYLPDWNRYGKRAGAIRNAEMVAKADTVVAFWDGKSKGTKITIDMARHARKLELVFGPSGLPISIDVATSVGVTRK